MSDASKWLQLVDIMSSLRGPEGCPWDKAQDHDSLKKYLLEECYEVLDAIDSRRDAALCDELGDVLLQVVFHAQLAAERGSFTIDDVVEGVSRKMIRRHPHIFGQAQAHDPEQVLTLWEAIKAQERSASDRSEKRGLMDVNDNLPSLMTAQKVQDKAHRVGFDWPDSQGAWDKLYEEAGELRQAQDKDQAEAELGDLLFAAVNLARFYEADAEQALRRSNRKFISRFRHIERRLEETGRQWDQCDLAELDHWWDEAKALERAAAMAGEDSK